MTFCALLVPRKAIIERDDRAFSEVPLIQHRHFLDLARDWIFAETLISITFAVYMEKYMEGRDAKKRRGRDMGGRQSVTIIELCWRFNTHDRRKWLWYI